MEAHLLASVKLKPTGMTRCEFDRLIELGPEIELIIGRRKVGSKHVLDVLDSSDMDEMKITVGDFIRCLHAQQHLVDLFDACDVDGEGFVSPRELRVALDQDDFATRILARLDVNGQLNLGQEKKITWNEFSKRLVKARIKE